jgi:osmotically-inducible protein OsmY
MVVAAAGVGMDTPSSQRTARSDSEILDTIRTAFEWQLFYELSITVISGTVTLEGSVGSWSERQNLATVVRQIDGVGNVINRLVVRAVPVGEMTLRMAIEQALARHAMREARRIDVTITGARVTVSGMIGSAAERDAVIGALVGTAGVGSVDDLLEIQAWPPVQ